MKLTASTAMYAGALIGMGVTFLWFAAQGWKTGIVRHRGTEIRRSENPAVFHLYLLFYLGIAGVCAIATYFYMFARRI